MYNYSKLEYKSNAPKKES